jgi:hypothetical protein
MSDKIARVILRVDGEGRDVQLYRGKLLHEYGLPYAVADEGALGSLPDHTKIPLDASLLEELPDDEQGFPLFFYRAAVVLHQ